MAATDDGVPPDLAMTDEWWASLQADVESQLGGAVHEPGTPPVPWWSPMAGGESAPIACVTTRAALPTFAGMVTGLVGAGESGKSFLALHAAVDVARHGHAALIIDGEMTRTTVCARLRNLGATDDELGRMFYADMADVILGGQIIAGAVVDTCHALGVRLVVIDSAAALLSRTARSENDNLEVTRVLDQLRAVVTDAPWGVVLVDHTAKGGLIATPRGASAKFNVLDVQYGVTLTGIPGTDAEWSVVVTVEKDRHAVMSTRRDREVVFHPLGGRSLSLDVSESAGATNRLAVDPVARAVTAMDALDPPPKSANDAAARIGGTRAVALSAFAMWKADR